MAEALDLDVDDPDKVSSVLRYAAEQFYDSEVELNSAWQDKSGAVWGKIARILEKAADAVDKLGTARSGNYRKKL